MEENKAITWSLQLFDQELTPNQTTFEQQRQYLIQVVAQLIDTNYHKLTNILYRIDVDELKLKKALLESDQPISVTIADLIIERQLQKLKYRNRF